MYDEISFVMCVCEMSGVCDVMYEMRCVYDKFGDVCV